MAALLMLVAVAWISDVALAWLGGLRWADGHFLLPSAGTFLAAGWLAIAASSAVPVLRRRLFSTSALLLMLAAGFLLWIQRLGWRPSDHHIGVAPWWILTAILLGVPFAVTRVRPALLIAAAPLLMLGYHIARTPGFRGDLRQIADGRALAALGLAVALFFASRLGVAHGVRRLSIAFGVLVAIIGTGVFIAWSNKSFVDESIRPGHHDAAAKGENIVFVVVDTLRADRLGAYGYRVRDTSPFLNRFASNATLFRNAYASTTWTVPSVATMFTGLPPEMHGVTAYGRTLRPGESVLTEQLRRSGYHTIGVSTNPIIDRDGGFARGFDRFALLSRLLTETGSSSLWADAIIVLQHGSRNGWLPRLFAGWTVKPRAADAVDVALSRLDAAPRGVPVFLFVHLLDPHHPPSVLANEATKAWRTTAADQRFDAAWSLGYDREIRYIDAQLERFISAVDRRLAPNQTTIVIVADHGEQLGEDSKRGHGANLDEAVLRVPLIVRRAGQAGRVVEEPFSLNGLREFIVNPGVLPGSPFIRAHLVPPTEPDMLFRSIQIRSWKLVEITRAGTPSWRQEMLFVLPDETTNRAAESPLIAGDLRLKLAELPSTAISTKYDAETAAKLRSLGYLQ